MLAILVYLLACYFLGCLFCNIELGEYYVWYSGIWHGLFLFPT